MSVVLSFRELSLGYDRRPAVHHLDGDIAAGDLVAIAGPNGAGKSTLLKGISGVLSPLRGSIDRHGASARDFAFLPQAADIDRSFPIDVFDLVAMGLARSGGLFGGIGRHGRERIFDAIRAVGLSGFERRGIGTLSGGQMQRALFARVLLQDARVILLDEPFNAIDNTTLRHLLDLVARWHGEGRTILAVLHDFELVRANFPQCLLLARSPVAWGATGEVLSARNLSLANDMCEAHEHEPDRSRQAA